MKPIYHYASVSVALEELRKNGFIKDFNLPDEHIKTNPHLYKILHIYRYEGNTDPGDEAVVYGIQSSSGEKGVFVAGYSANSNSDVIQVLNEISIKNRVL
ncbi:hypothetical protein [uncultured Flavobacterium sp.]|jgi:hypothetical protein|uniref:hypothetical protein n=1 Tax=uncultured Flavobacterium sp. TaxID=165435 RepID=UPI0030CA37AC